ncbi:MAG: MBL fold metallo-hydrolase [Candidatus Thalassarchaeaceae archaeon]|nr:MBL fold metallo-hydrolase [Candidatus Thalassarchaeaceae archaeon]
MLSDGEFHSAIWDDGVEVWITQMGSLMNMNTAFVDRANGVVAIIDPYDAKKWISKLEQEGLEPTHLLYTHTHRDHAAGYPGMIKRYPNLEVWGHEDARVPNLLGHIVFRNVDFTDTWRSSPGESVDWSAGSIFLTVTHSPGHAPGHVTFHGHGVYHAGDLLFVRSAGRVDLPGGDPQAQQRSLIRAKEILQGLPPDWRLIPGHRYDDFKGEVPDWINLGDALKHNYFLSNITMID